MEIKKRFYTTSEVAEILGATYLTIYRMIRDGKIKAIKLGRDYRISYDELDKYIQRNKA